MKLLTIFLGLFVILAVFATQAKAEPEPEPEPKFGLGKIFKKVIKTGTKAVVKVVKKVTPKVVKVVKKVAKNEDVQNAVIGFAVEKGLQLLNQQNGEAQPEEVEEIVEYVEEE